MPQAAKATLLVREALRSRHYSKRTEATYVQWIKRFILFHQKRHPAEMAEAEVNQFLTHLAVKEKVSASTQNQALSALLFLYRYVLAHELGQLGDIIRARKIKALAGCIHTRRSKSSIEQAKRRAAVNRCPYVRHRHEVDGVSSFARKRY